MLAHVVAQQGGGPGAQSVPRNARQPTPGHIAIPPGRDFLGLRFNVDTMDRVIEQIGNRSPRESFAYVVTPNVDHVVRLHNMRTDLWPAYRHAWLTLCDSRILRGLAIRAGVRLSTLPGSDLTEALFQKVIKPSDRVAILGGDAEPIAKMCARFNLENVAHFSPPMGFIENESEVERAITFLREARARYVLLAVGSPQQEIVAYRIEKAGTATGIGFCVGASLDFLTGRQRRAPIVMQRLSLEWLHRLLSAPGRMWRRYLVDGPLILSIYRSWRSRLFS